MSEPFIGSIAMFGFNFAPRGWAFCSGQILPINQNQSLFSLLGTTYGGDGRTTFALPDLRGRAPMHTGNGHALGQRTGSETVTLTTDQMAPHSHSAQASSDDATESTSAGQVPANIASPQNNYGDAAALVAGGADQILPAGGGQAHNNMQPSNTLNFCIALQGSFPSRN